MKLSTPFLLSRFPFLLSPVRERLSSLKHAHPITGAHWPSHLVIHALSLFIIRARWFVWPPTAHPERRVATVLARYFCHSQQPNKRAGRRRNRKSLLLDVPILQECVRIRLATGATRMAGFPATAPWRMWPQLSSAGQASAATGDELSTLALINYPTDSHLNGY